MCTQVGLVFESGTFQKWIYDKGHFMRNTGKGEKEAKWF